MTTQLLRHLLEEEGFSWSDLATTAMCKVAVLRAYRDDPLSLDPMRAASIHQDLALLATFVAIAHERGCEEPATLLNAVVVEGCTMTGWDLYWAGDHAVLYVLAAGASEPEAVLDRYVPDWRVAYQSDYEVFLDQDGHHSIRRKDGS